MWANNIDEGTLFTGTIHGITGTFFKTPKRIQCLELWHRTKEGRIRYWEQTGLWVQNYSPIALKPFDYTVLCKGYQCLNTTSTL